VIHWYGNHFGWNAFFFPGNSLVKVRRPLSAPKPADAYLLADKAYGAYIRWDTSGIDNGWRARHGVNSDKLAVENPMGNVNVAYLDGHVQSLPWSAVKLGSSSLVEWSGGY